MRRELVLVTLVACAGVAMLAATAGADDNKVKSKLTLKNPEPGVYEGKVKSKKKGCREDREVDVRHDRDKDGYDRKDTPIGKAPTTVNGSWRVLAPLLPPGEAVSAKVRKAKAGNKVCKPDTDELVVEEMLLPL